VSREQRPQNRADHPSPTHPESRPEVDFHFALFLIIGSVVGASIGARILNRIPEREVTLIVAAVLLIVGLKEVIAP